MTFMPRGLQAMSVVVLLLCIAGAARAELLFPPPEFSRPYQYPQTILPVPRAEIFS
jgi:hypothetical protein